VGDTVQVVYRLMFSLFIQLYVAMSLFGYAVIVMAGHDRTIAIVLAFTIPFVFFSIHAYAFWIGFRQKSHRGHYDYEENGEL